jgi:hypothetical protein
MNKSFKKVVAGALSLLMVATSVPFTASAAAGDYEPNVNLEFGTVSNVAYTGLFCGEGAYEYNPSGKKDDSANESLDYAGLFGAPIDYDWKNGTLTLKASKTEDIAEDLAEDYETEALTEDYVYQVGDYFMVTITIENIKTMNTAEIYVSYPDNVEPAGVFAYGTKSSNARYMFKTLSEYNDDVDSYLDSTNTPGALVSGQCSDSFYARTNNVIDLSYVNTTKRYMDSRSGASVDADDVSYTPSTSTRVFYSPEDGSRNYNYTDTFIAETFMFKIVDDGPIVFDLYDKDNSVGAFVGCYYIADDADGKGDDKYTTYAFNDSYYENGSIVWHGGEECAGSRKMTFMGTNENWDTVEEDCEHPDDKLTEVSREVTKDPTCTETGLATVTYTCSNCGETVEKTNVEVAIDADAHPTDKLVEVSTSVTTAPTCTATGAKTVTYECSACGKTVVKEGVEVAIDGTAHPTDKLTEVSRNVTKAATCSATGLADVTYQCSACGESVVVSGVEVAIDPTAHTASDTLANVKDATCTTDGYTGDVVCKDCGAVITAGTKIDATGHSFTNYVADNNHATHTATCDNNCGEKDTQDCDYTNYQVVTPATFTSTGVGSYTCSVCGDVKEVVIPVQDCAHANTHQEENVTLEPTCTVAGSKTVSTICDDCGQTIDTQVVSIDPTGHDWNDGEITTPATCEATGVKTFTCKNDSTHTYTEDVQATGHDWNDGEITTPATCSETGVKTFTCNNDATHTYTETVAIDPTAHTASDTLANVKAATCSAEGYTGDVVCKYCDAVITAGTATEKIAHTAGTPVVTEVPATVDAAGSKTTVTKCEVCGEVLDSQVETLPILESYTVTVDATDLGTTTVNDVDATNGTTVKVVKQGAVTLTATPNDNAQFVGWTANGKSLVSTDATYTTTALANITYTPVFSENAETFSVTFVDAYGNVISTQVVTSGADVVVPADPSRAGYTFAGWSLTAEEIAAIDTATTITASFEKDAAALYTVTATGCTITVGGEDKADVATDVAYDTSVTVQADGATSWKIGDATVAYGESYTFYVGSDVTVVPQYDADVVVAPTVANVSVSATGNTGAIKATFLATRSMEGFTLVNAGFVYGKGDIANSTLDSVDGSAVKAIYCSTASNQFSLSYGLKAQSGKVSARAFVAYVDGNGDTQVIYAETQVFDYANA